MLSTTPGANANLVADLYTDVLGRLAPPAEINYWTGQLAAGQTTDSVVVGFVLSVEHRQNVVNQVYQEFLDRAPDDAGVNYWVGVLGQGTSEFVLESYIVGSQEYYDRQGGDNAGYIRGLYRDVLHRTTPPGPSEISYWSNSMNAGASRGSVALGFIDSPEFAGVGVDQLYRDYLKRDSDAGGYAYWLSQLQQGATTFDIERFLLDSQEYDNLAQRQLEPGSTLTLLAESIDPTADLMVEFSDQQGFRLDVPPVAASSTDATVVVPPLIDPATGHSATGTVTVQLLQNSMPVTSATVGALQIENLPTNPFPAGQVTSGYLGAAIQALQQVTSQLSGTVFDSPSLRAALTAQMADLNELSGDVQAVVADPTKSFDLGQFGNQHVTLGSTQLALLDQLTLAALDGIGHAAGASTPAAAQSALVSDGPPTGSSQSPADAVQLPNDNLVVNYLRARSDPTPDTMRPLLFPSDPDVPEWVHEVGEFLLEFGVHAIISPEVWAAGPAAYPLFAVSAVVTPLGYMLKNLDSFDLSVLRAMADDAKRFATSSIDQALGQASGAVSGFISNADVAMDALQQAGPPGEILLNAAPGLTTHEVLQDQVQFEVQLTKKPTGVVTINLNDGAPQEGQMSPSTLVFNSTNWWFPQLVTITAIDRHIDDGNQTYNVTLDAAQSNDPAYDGLVPNPNTVTITNIDDNHAGVIVTPTSGLVTTEQGGSATFTVQLTSQPLAPVTIFLTSSDTTEGNVTPGDVTFSAGNNSNWNVPQVVTVTGVSDGDDEGNVAYTIKATHTGSADPKYNVLDVPDVSVVNVDVGTPEPTPDTTGTWRGPFSESNPLSTISGTMTITIQAFPKYTTVVTGTVDTGSSSDSFTGTVKGQHCVFDLDLEPGFIIEQLVGTVIGNKMQGAITLIDENGGKTTGEYDLTKID